MKNPPGLGWVSGLFEAYFVALIHTPRSGHSNSSNMRWPGPPLGASPSCASPSWVADPKSAPPPATGRHHGAVCPTCGYFSPYVQPQRSVNRPPSGYRPFAPLQNALRPAHRFDCNRPSFPSPLLRDFNNVTTRIPHIQIRLASNGGSATMKSPLFRSKFSIALPPVPSYSVQAFRRDARTSHPLRRARHRRFA